MLVVVRHGNVPVHFQGTQKPDTQGNEITPTEPSTPNEILGLPQLARSALLNE